MAHATKRKPRLGLFGASCAVALVCGAAPSSAQTSGAAFDTAATNHATQMLKDGRKIFRFDTFGSEAFWGDTLRAAPGHRRREATAASAPASARRRRSSVGLKVDVDALPEALDDADQGRQGRSRRPGDDAGPAQARTRWSASTAFANPDGKLQVGGHPVRALPLHRRRLLRARHRQAARRLGRTATSTSARSCRWRPNLKPFTDLLGVDERDGEEGADQLGPGQLRRRARHGRQGVPARRQARRRR